MFLMTMMMMIMMMMMMMMTVYRNTASSLPRPQLQNLHLVSFIYKLFFVTFRLQLLLSYPVVIQVIFVIDIHRGPIKMSLFLFRGYLTAVFISARISSPSVDNCPRRSRGQLLTEGCIGPQCRY